LALVFFLFKHFILPNLNTLESYLHSLISRWNFQFLSGVIIFGSVRFLSKKNNQTEFFLKKPKRFKPTGFGSVRFFRAKPGSNRCDLVFCRFDSVFFGFRFIKPKPNWTGRFFQNFNRFFFTVQFFQLLFSSFLGFFLFFCLLLVFMFFMW
jgi:hypothetical protein